jgi:cAMP-dependent protein kinase regulator
MIDWLQAEKDVPGSRKGSVTLGNKRDSDSEGEEDDEVEDLPVIAPMAKASIVGNQRKSVSAEAYGVFNKKADFKPRVIPKTVEQKKSIEKRLSQAFMFSALEEKDKQIVINAMEEKRFKKGDYVIRQYEDGDVLYIVDSGELDCYKQYKKGEEEKMVKNYFPGDSFGELALLYNAPRAATIKAKTDSLLWALDRECFNNIVKEAAVKKREKYEEMLKKVDILETMEAYEKSVIAEALQTVELKSGDRIIQEGDILTDFYFVEEGAVQKLSEFF